MERTQKRSRAGGQRGSRAPKMAIGILITARHLSRPEHVGHRHRGHALARGGLGHGCAQAYRDLPALPRADRGDGADAGRVSLALVSVGLQLRLERLGDNGPPLAIGLAFKLLIAPLVFALLYFEFFRARDIGKVTIFESAMVPQIGGAIVAIQYGLNPKLTTLMVGIGIPASFLTLPMCWYAMQAL
jgi:hypothetical protein